ncbi:MAG: pentapeptide repeat-containing protein, partial [Snowella sp.]|nr:pentapeptide repeat-containing protein [Snowella sp.]
NVQITEDQFMQAMAEIAVACWHGNGRTTTVAEIEKHCQHSGIGSVLEVFKTSGSQGVTQLLTAFYFRQQGVQGTDKTFEFTHKSFREYLTTRRMITEIEAFKDELGRHRSNGRGWNEQECLRRWAVLCGAEAMDRYLFDWLLGEVQLQPVEQVVKWQQLFCDLISYMLRQGMPMEKLDRLTFLQMSYQSRNAEEALLVVLNACASVTKRISTIKWEKRESFSEWLSKLQKQRIDDNQTLAFDCFSYLDLAGCLLLLKDLRHANLEGTDLKGADLEGADLERTHMEGAVLKGADLEGAELQWANLNGANLQEANLRWADLQETSLLWADLQEANLQNAKLYGADLYEANLNGANLYEANLQEANLYGADLQEADLQGANLQDVRLKGANLQEANLQGANLQGANLQWAKLYRADLYEANLQGANLQGAKLRKADLEDVNTENVDLSEVIWVDDDGNPLNENL